MIPLHDNIPSRRFPWITLGLIVTNGAIYLFEALLSSRGLNAFVWIYGVTPAYFTLGGWPYPGVIPLAATLITTQFLHGSLLHVFGNMLYLWIFGDNIEDRLGSIRYLTLYLASGAIGALTHIGLNPVSRTPVVGASGAIAGVLGAYLVMYPWAKVRTLVFLGIFFTTINVPALLFLGFWFIMQLWSGTQASAGTAQDFVAYGAHVGGFVAGLVLVKLLDPNRSRYNA